MLLAIMAVNTKNNTHNGKFTDNDGQNIMKMRPTTRCMLQLYQLSK